MKAFCHKCRKSVGVREPDRCSKCGRVIWELVARPMGSDPDANKRYLTADVVKQIKRAKR